MIGKEHWENLYATKTDAQLSWTQADPRVSIALIHEVAPRGDVIDVGGGSGALAARLVEAGYSVTVLDISPAALAAARRRLGDKASRVRWIAGDVTAVADAGTFDVWHDRAVFHFLTDASDREKYVALARRSVRVGGHLIVGTFALDGPPQCSGLAVERYDGAKLDAEFANGFARKKEIAETHLTPWGAVQRFTWAVIERVAPIGRR